MPAPMPTDTVRPQSERKASPTARGPWPRSQSERTPKTTRNGVALNGRIPANPATRIAAATRSSGSRNRCARRASRKPPGVTPMLEDPMDRGEYHTVGHRTKPLPHHRSLWNRNALRFRHDLSPSDRPGEVLEKVGRSEEHTSELQSHSDLVCRLLLEKKKKTKKKTQPQNATARLR